MASYTGTEDANLQVRLEYAANIDASNETIGRESTLPLHLHFLPSLEVPLLLLMTLSTHIILHEFPVSIQSPSSIQAVHSLKVHASK